MLRWPVPNARTALCFGARSAQQPTDAEAQRDKKQRREDAARAEDLKNLVEVGSGDQTYQED